MKQVYLKNNLRKLRSILNSFGILAFFIAITQWNFAQVSTYAFNTTTSTFTPITGGLLLGSETSDDQRFVDPAAPLGGTVTTGVGLPIGFTFAYNNENYNVLAINNNGWICFGNSALTPAINITSSSSYTALSSTSVVTPTHLRNRIAALSRDLQAQVGASLRLETIGAAPNRVCVIQWLDYKKFGTTGTGDSYDFQIRLYETSNVVEVVYGDFINNATAITAQVGLGGSVPTDFNNRTTTTDWTATTAGATNTATCTGSASVFPASGTTFRWAGPPPTPPVPFQAAGIPSCLTGTNLDVVGTPDPDVLWYWQTSASGTSTTDLYSGPFNVLTNGTYYLRAFSTVTLAWSTNSSSITVSNFPLAAAPPIPGATQNPACVTNGTEIFAGTPPAGTAYFWQGTTLNGVSDALPASVPMPITTTGTYHVAAYDSTTQCWSNTSSLLVTIDTQIPLDPVADPTDFFVCNGATTVDLTAVNPMIVTSLATQNTGGNGCTSGAMVDVTTNANPVTITSIDARVNIAGAQTVNVYYKLNTYVGSETNAAAWTLLGSYPINAVATQDLVNVDIDDLTIPAGTTYGIYMNYNASYSNLSSTYSDSYMTITTGAGFCTTFSGPIAGRTFNGVFYYLIPSNATLSWHDAATGGNELGAGSPFNGVGTSVLPAPAANGTYEFYAQAMEGACPSINRALVTVNVNDVNVSLLPIPVSCNNGNNGSFVISNIDCGTAPFSFAVDGGAFGSVGAFPTNLTVGSHTITVRDINNLESGVYTIIIEDALAPSGATVNTFNNDIVDLSWNANGSETTWNIEWGTPGFVPGTGAQIGSATATDTNYVVSGLDGNVTYEFYISANCGAGTTPGEWISIVQTTLCDAFVAQSFCESFDSDSPTQACWSILNGNNDVDSWSMDYATNPFAGDQCASILTNLNAGNNDDWLISPGLILTNNEIMSFNYRAALLADPSDFEVLLSTTGTSPADFTDTLMYLNSYSNIVYADTAIDLSAFSGTCYIAFHIPQGGIDGNRLYIDEFCVDICTPDPGTDGAIDVCRLDQTIDLNAIITQGENNGTWYFAPNPSALDTAELTISSLADGTYSASYVVTTACVSDTTVATFTVVDPSSAGTDGVLTVCKNQPINLLAGLSGNIDLGGTWYGPNGNALPNSQIISGSLPGQFNYNYIVTNGVCPNDTANIIMNILSGCDYAGLDDFVFEDLTIYPNPTTGLFQISNVASGLNFSYEITDLNGRIISSKENMNGTQIHEVNLSKVENGIYMVRVFNDSGESMTRIVKQ